MHFNEKLLCHHPCSVLFVMNFENIVISPPDNYTFLNCVPSVINLHDLQIGKSKNRLEVSFYHSYTCNKSCFSRYQFLSCALNLGAWNLSPNLRDILDGGHELHGVAGRGCAADGWAWEAVHAVKHNQAEHCPAVLEKAKLYEIKFSR